MCIRDRDPGVLQAARERKAVHAVGGPELLREADLLVLALAPESAIAFLRENRALLPSGTVVTDVCGVKRAVVEVCSSLCRESGLHFIGGHPMAGKEHSGFSNADAGLFQGASYILTPEKDTPPAALSLLQELASALGCGRITAVSYTHLDVYKRQHQFGAGRRTGPLHDLQRFSPQLGACLLYTSTKIALRIRFVYFI